MKSSTSFVCQECGYDSPAYLGKCPECGEWNSIKEIKTGPINSSSRKTAREASNINPKTLKEIKYDVKERLLTSFSEMDGVLGGGIVHGSVILLAGDPGIGKSTLLLQLAMGVSKKNKVLYVSGEESEQQIKIRANRLKTTHNASDLLILSSTSTDVVVSVIAEVKPDLVIIDSIQTMESENLPGLSGSVSQVRYSTSEFIKLAKTLNIPIIIVGHVTKEGMVAGPMILSHMVDTVLFLEGEKITTMRILRSFKNRFGPVDEVGVFTMDSEGMKEVGNPEQIFLSGAKNNRAPGSSIVATLEGTRAFLVEIQALVVFSKLPMPRRVALGIDSRRLELLIAVLQKHCRLPLDTMDVFVNVAGGLRLSDPASDLGICLAIFSSFKNIPISKIVGIAEVGLLGELRKAGNLEKRVKEAKKLGFSDIITAEKYKFLNDVLTNYGKN